LIASAPNNTTYALGFVQKSVKIPFEGSNKIKRIVMAKKNCDKEEILKEIS
jgi:hypothetical protein